MPIFQRRSKLPAQQKGANYRKFKPSLRTDFRECCAYCLLYDLLAGGEEAFEIDHFKPKSDDRFAALICDYTNLYYSCAMCNRYKSSAWPSDELQAKGYRFIDWCRDDFSEHFVDQPSGEWRPVSPAGEYSAKRMRLNRRGLLRIRQMVQRIASLRKESPLNWATASAREFDRCLGGDIP